MPHFRTKTGCLTCRQRKKKCDESRPMCSGCIRNRLSCTWPSRPSQFAPDIPMHEPYSPRGKSADISNDDEIAVRWNTRSMSFLANDRACFLMSISPALLQHYICETGTMLPAESGHCNPYIAYIVPLAYSDDLLMHAIMCLSAAHLSCKQGDTVETDKAVSVHYSAALRSIRNEIGSLTGIDHRKLLRLLLVLVFIAFYEAASGDVSGSMFAHLRAGRQLIACLDDQKDISLPEDRKVLAFATELYAFTIYINTFTPFGLMPTRTISCDSEFVVTDYLMEQESFGFMFIGLHDLYKLIPRISQLASMRLEEERSNVISTRAQTIFQDIQSGIESFRLSIEHASHAGGSSQESWEAKKKAAEIYKHGLRIFLSSSMAGSLIVDDEVRLHVQRQAASIIEIADSIENLQITASLLWPYIIAGSCLVDPQHQTGYLMKLSNNKYNMYHILQCCNLLRLLWNDDDPRCFATYGLYFTMQKHNMHISIF